MKQATSRRKYRYGSIPIDTFLVGWTSIYQLFWGSLGTRVLTHPHIINLQLLESKLGIEHFLSYLRLWTMIGVQWLLFAFGKTLSKTILCSTIIALQKTEPKKKSLHCRTCWKAELHHGQGLDANLEDEGMGLHKPGFHGSCSAKSKRLDPKAPHLWHFIALHATSTITTRPGKLTVCYWKWP